MANLQSLNLKYNPYRDITPAFDGPNLIWAEMEDVKSRISKNYEECLNHKAKQIVLNWGPYGGGKTFSAYYFIKQYKDQPNLKHIYLRCPKDGAKATPELFKSIIDSLTFDAIHAHIRSLLAAEGEDSLIDFLSPKASREYAKAICLIGSDDEEIKALMNRFLYAGLTKTELKKLGLAKTLQSDADLIKFLSGIFLCFTEYKAAYDGCVVIWIDEMEDLIYYSPKHYKAFSQVLRDLFDSISKSFLLFMNFTLAENEESTIELILGGAVWSRITKKIRYKPFTIEMGVTYSIELLQHAKINPALDAPMGKPIIDSVVSSIPLNNLTPREINKHFSSLISYAENDDVTIIDQSMLNKWIKENEENE
jgi:hypothetical protein